VRLRLAALLALLLAGCAHQSPPATQAAPELPEHWRTLVGPQEALTRDWWARFGDPVLTALVEAALANNLDVATAMARVREARAQEASARSQLVPSLDFSLGGNRARTLNAFGLPSLATTIQPAFQAAYEVDLSGRLGEQVEAARAGTLAGEAGAASAGLAVAAATATGYITLRSLDARLVVLQDTVRTRGEAVRIARRRAEVGYTSDLELRQAQAEYESAALQVPATQLAMERQEHALALLAGRPPVDIARGLPLARLTPPPVPADR
jgi:multidrug efflux system outer membrane protein